MLKRIFLFVLMFAIILGCFTACGKKSDEELIERRIGSFVKAYNAGDLDKVIENLSYSERTEMQSYIKLIEGIGFSYSGVSGNLDMSAIFGIAMGSTVVNAKESVTVNIPENITATMIGKHNYIKYCMPFYTEFKEKLQDANIAVVTHLDGALKPLWDQIGASAIDGIDSFTPVPTGDTGVGEALSMWPEKRLLCNFPSSVHLESPEVVYGVAKKILEEGGHSGRLWIQISENVPKDVWKTSFPAILQAIRFS